MRRFLSLLVLTSSVLLSACGKPVITEECVMNGRGEGTCSFTNTGDSDGSMCGTVVVVKPAEKSPPYGKSEQSESSTFCSGTISKDTTTSQISFNVPRLSEMCSVNSRPWDETCGFAFSSSSGSGAGWIRNFLILILVTVASGLIWRYFPTIKSLFENNSRKCPFCAESVKPQAIICKSCGKDIHEQAAHQNPMEKTADKSVEVILEGKQLFSAKLKTIKLWWKQQFFGGKLIVASLLAAIVSMFMNWLVIDGLAEYSQLMGIFTIGFGVSIAYFFAIAAFWLYPIWIVLKNSVFNFYIGIACPTVSLLWTFYEFYSNYSLSLAMESHGYETIKIGLGIWFYMLASIVLFVGVALYKPSQKEQLEAVVDN